MNVHTDNLASSMIKDLIVAIKRYVIPSHVRADGSGEFTSE